MEKRKNSIYYISAFLIPILTLLILFLCQNMIFKETIFISDMQGQYISLFNYFKNNFGSLNSMFYSFSKGIGGSMIGTYSYYLSSPLNWIVCLFSQSNLNIALIIILFIKIGLSGLFMYLFLKNTVLKCSKIHLLIFSSCYALMSYNIAYYFHIMWLDCVYLLPLIMLGIYKIVNKKSGLLYGITLFIAIFCNYYIGYMICIFSCLFLIYQIFLKYKWKSDKKEILKILIRFIIISLLSALLTAVLIIPTLLELLNSVKNNNLNIFSNITISFDILKIIQNMIFVDYGIDNILNNNMPLIYCGIINFILVLFYFFNSKINKKEKFLSLSLLFVFLISFSVNILNYAWHGFNIPLCFNFRYSFIYVFLCIYLACQSFTKAKYIKKYSYYIVFIIIELLTLYSIIFVKNYYIYINLVISLLYLLIIYLLNHYKDKKLLKQFNIILIFLVIAELLTNSYLTIRGYSIYSNKEYKDNLKVIGTELNKIKDDESSFYRIENTYKYTHLDSFLFDIHNASTFLSTLESNSHSFMNNIGVNNLVNSYKYSIGNNKFLDSIFGIKYFITTTEKYENYQKKDKFSFSKFPSILYDLDKRDYYIFENPYNLNLGFTISNNSLDFVTKLKENKVMDHLNFQNVVAATMMKSDYKIFKELPYTKIGVDEYEFEILNDSDIYISFYADFEYEDDTLNIYIDGNLYQSLNNQNYSTIILKNNYEVGNKIKVKLIKSKNFPLENDIHPYYFDEEIFEKFYKEASANQLNITSFKDTNIKGKITSTKDKNILFTTIPYDKGWSVKVDGKKVKTLKLYDSFLGVKLEEGEHEIEFSYFPPGLKIGTIVSMISLVMFIAYFKFENKKINN